MIVLTLNPHNFFRGLPHLWMIIMLVHHWISPSKQHENIRRSPSIPNRCDTVNHYGRWCGSQWQAEHYAEEFKARPYQFGLSSFLNSLRQTFLKSEVDDYRRAQNSHRATGGERESVGNIMQTRIPQYFSLRQKSKGNQMVWNNFHCIRIR